MNGSAGEQEGGVGVVVTSEPTVRSDGQNPRFPPVLAGERNEELMPAAVALHADEAVFQAAAGEIAAELIQHEPRQRPLALGEAALEGGPVLFHEGVEDAVFGAMPLVAQHTRCGWRQLGLDGVGASVCMPDDVGRAPPIRSGDGRASLWEMAARMGE